MSKHVLALVVLDAAEEPPARHVFAGLVLQGRDAADIDRLLVEAPSPERQPAKAAFEHPHAQCGIAVEEAAADERGDKPHRAPRVRRGAADKDVLPQIEVARVIGRVPGKAVIGDRQIVVCGGLPDRVEVGVVGRHVLGQERHHRDRPFRLAPFADLAHCLGHVARGGDDHALEPVWIVAAEIRHVAVIGADHADLERRVVEPDDTEPRGRDQEMDIGPFVVHVRDPVAGLIVLDAGTRHLGSHPPCVTAGERLARRLLAEHPAIELGPDPVIVQLAVAFDRLADRQAIGRQFRQARAKAGVDIALQHLGGRVDVGIGIIDAIAVPHPSLSSIRALAGAVFVHRASYGRRLGLSTISASRPMLTPPGAAGFRAG